MVEFALTTLLFLGLLFGIIEFGRFWFYSSHLSNSVRAAARSAAVWPDSLTVRDYAEDYARTEITSYLPSEGLTVYPVQVIDEYGVLRDPSVGAARRDIIRVSVQYDFRVLTGTLIPGFDGVIPLRRTASVNYESD